MITDSAPVSVNPTAVQNGGQRVGAVRELATSQRPTALPVPQHVARFGRSVPLLDGGTAFHAQLARDNDPRARDSYGLSADERRLANRLREPNGNTALAPPGLTRLSGTRDAGIAATVVEIGADGVPSIRTVKPALDVAAAAAHTIGRDVSISV